MSSSCVNCNAVEQRGRYCVGCGTRMPPSQLPPRRIRLAPRPLEHDDTQPVLRLRHGVPRPRVEAETPAAV
jgi:hypothetical protein